MISILKQTFRNIHLHIRHDSYVYICVYILWKSAQHMTRSVMCDVICQMTFENWSARAKNDSRDLSLSLFLSLAREASTRRRWAPMSATSTSTSPLQVGQLDSPRCGGTRGDVCETARPFHRFVSEANWSDLALVRDSTFHWTLDLN